MLAAVHESEVDMRAMVVYESFFGNTRRIAESIADGLRGGLDVQVVEAGQAGRPTEDVDLLVVGGPTHAWSMSRDMTRRGAREQARQKHTEPVSTGIGVREWLRQLQRTRGARMAAAFDTAIRSMGPIPSGSAARGEADALEEHGYRLVSEPEQFFVKDIDGPLDEGELERARAWGMRLAARASERAFVAPRSRRRPVESVGAIVGHALTLLFVNLHELWRPWTSGVVTDAWAQVAGTIGLACLVGIVGNGLLLMFPARSLRPFVACAIAGTGLAALAVVHGVFPFAFAGFGMAWFDPVLRVILLVGLIGAAIGFAVQLVRLMLAVARG